MSAFKGEGAAGKPGSAGSLVRPQPRLRETGNAGWLDRNLLGVVVFAHVIGCLMVPALMSASTAYSFSGMPVFCLLGTAIVVPVAAGFSLVYAPVPFVIRVFVATLVVAACYGAFWTSNTLLYGGPEIPQMLSWFTVWPGPILGFAFAFAVMRFFKDRVLISPVAHLAPPEKLSIVGIMMATALVAICTTIAGVKPELMLAYGISAVSCAGLGLLLFVPMTMFLFRCRRFWTFVLAFSFVAAVTGSTASFLTGIARGEFWIVVGCGLGLATLILTWGAHVYAYRNAGYQLVRMPEIERKIVQGGTAEATR
ncbi:MAG: hypothetical protein AAF456_15875 [Planctomycetota bacterium]